VLRLVDVGLDDAPLFGCIARLTENAGLDPVRAARFVPFRRAALTWLLRNALCGRVDTAVLCTVSPADTSCGGVGARCGTR